ncbi:hypothetical protein NliqN6_0317 [Naganishia liquefaciens]|uniref:WD40 repeat domain-containing protein n=1 Tax=Naganishia liquefaciens TaxID=104408 RepID=A0A8H3TMP7_9TREE|nr:hypothetical protein NliqN6_0317 [Naganishia liquefaciens]
MSDPFFAKDNKRKRSGAKGPAAKPYEKPYRPAAYGKGQKSGANVDGKRRRTRDEDLASDNEERAGGGDAGDIDDMDFMTDRFGMQAEYDSAEEEDRNRNETAAAKRLRLAKGYLEKVKSEVQVDDGSWDAQDIDNANVTARLQQDVDEAAGRIHTFFADALRFAPFSRKFLPSLGGQVPTAAQASSTDLFTANKEGALARYSLGDLKMVGTPFGQSVTNVGKKGGKGKQGGKAGKAKGGATVKDGKAAVQGHAGAVLCLAASEDGKYLLTGGKDKVIGVWQLETPVLSSEDGAGDAGVKWLRGLSGHKDAVTAIALPSLNNPSHQFVSASAARSLCLHSISTLSLIDTFFGHQDAINAVSSIKPTIAVTSGARDRTCRWWKVEEEVQLVFRAGIKSNESKKAEAQDAGSVAKASKGKGREFVEGSVDVVAMLDDQHFVSGGDSGAICLWHTGKKKPVFSEHLAHGTVQHESETEGAIVEPRWVTALAGLRGTNLFASGSWDGEIKLWALSPTLKSFSFVASIPAVGVVNSLQLLAVPHGKLKSDDWQKVASESEEMDVEGNGLIEKSSKRARIPADVLLVAAMGREPRLGRWIKVKDGAKNGTLLIHLGKP